MAGSKLRTPEPARFFGSSRSGRGSSETRLRTQAPTENSTSRFMQGWAATWEYSSPATWQRICRTMYVSAGALYRPRAVDELGRHALRILVVAAREQLRRQEGRAERGGEASCSYDRVLSCRC